MRAVRACLVCALTLSAQAGAEVIATFDDPAADSSTPLFAFDALSMELSGAWSLPGLTLETIGGVFNDVTFSMGPSSVDLFGGVSAGQIEFFDGAASILVITFDSGQLNPTTFGATEFLATNVVSFSGSVLPLPVENESFAFAFANQVDIGGGGFTATASFTSSADVVPEPATLVSLVLSGFLCCRRTHRRRRSFGNRGRSDGCLYCGVKMIRE